MRVASVQLLTVVAPPEPRVFGAGLLLVPLVPFAVAELPVGVGPLVADAVAAPVAPATVLLALVPVVRVGSARYVRMKDVNLHDLSLFIHTFCCRSFSCCSLSRLRMAAILVPGWLGVVFGVGVLAFTGGGAGVESDLLPLDAVEEARPIFVGVAAAAFSSSFAFSLLDLARPMVRGMTIETDDFFELPLLLLPLLELVDVASSAFLVGWFKRSTFTTSNSSRPRLS